MQVIFESRAGRALVAPAVRRPRGVDVDVVRRRVQARRPRAATC